MATNEEQQVADTATDGYYYVSVVDAGRTGLLAGPFEKHQTALDMVEKARNMAEEVDPYSVFYAFGTCKMPKTYTKPGVLNDRLGIRPEMLAV